MTRFIVETVEITDCDTDESRIAKVITDTNELYSYDDLYELCDDLNKLAEENKQLRQSYKYADELLEEIREVFEKNGVETGYNKRILETCFSALYENEQLRKELKEKQEDEKEYAREILRLNKLVKEYSEIRQLGGDY